MGDSLSIKELSSGDIYSILSLQETIYNGLLDKTYYICFDKKELEDSFREGGLSLGIKSSEGSLIAYSLVIKEGTLYHKEISDTYNINTDELVYHESIIVMDKYRGQGIQKLLMEATCGIMKERGIKCMWCRVHPDNVHSRRNIEAMGYVLFKEVNAWLGYPRCIYVKDLRD